MLNFVDWGDSNVNDVSPNPSEFLQKLHDLCVKYQVIDMSGGDWGIEIKFQNKEHLYCVGFKNPGYSYSKPVLDYGIRPKDDDD